MVGLLSQGRFFSAPFFSQLRVGIFFLCLLLLCSCAEQKVGEANQSTVGAKGLERIKSFPLTKSVQLTSGESLFQALPPEETGVDFRNEVSAAHRIRLGNIGTGVASGDIDQDGKIDLYFTGQDSGNRLYRQVGEWKFEDVTESAGGLDGQGATSTGPAFADIDNDGDLDLYVCNQDAANQLYINRGDGTFQEEASVRGVDSDSSSTMSAFCDYDLDGDLDLYLLTYRRPDLVDSGILATRKNLGERDILFQNDGAGHFTDVTREVGMDIGPGLGLSATWWDYNNDQWPDLFVANDFEVVDRLFHNRGDGTFVDVAAEAFPFLPWFSMGSDAADLNNDGLCDLIATDMAGTSHYQSKVQMGDIRNTANFLRDSFPKQFMRNTLFVNSGVGRFYESGYLTGMAASDWTWSVRIADFDNDGFQDVFFGNGYYINARDSDRELAQRIIDERQRKNPGSIEPIHDFLRERGFPEEVLQVESRKPLVQKNLAFRNRGNLQFDSVSEDWGFDEENVTFGATVVDLDGDGDLDIISNGLDDSIRLYRNESDSGSRVVVELKGTQSNRFGIGAKVTIETGGKQFTRWLRASRGYQGSDHPEVQFGLGVHEEIDRLVVNWPSGIVQEFQDLEAGFRYVIEEPAENPGTLPSAQAPFFGPGPNLSTKFQEVDSSVPSPAVHLEQYYNDFTDQLLLPFQLSQLGPGIAVGDLKPDGKNEIWLGGGMGQQGQFVSHDDKGVLRKREFFHNAARADSASEDMGGIFLDVNGDDHLDLFVVSGSVEWGENAEQLRDRLYLNDGEGKLMAASSGSVPELFDCGSVAAAADYDRDGDLDLFVGSRVSPGQYPVAVNSRILRNDGGKFVEATAQVLGSEDATIKGLTTSALWSDFDNDGWVDLAVAQEWGPVRIFLNKQGKLTELTGADARSNPVGQSPVGWWNGIAGGDFDNDGDIDLVATNFGFNTKYQIKEGKPREIFYSDFDGDGRMDLVEAKYEKGVLLPERGRSCSTLAMPSLSEKFPTYRKFASATLKDIFSEKGLADAYSLSASHLASSIFINDGSGNFEVRELPRLAQISPSMGVVVQDFDADGNLDIVLAQNFYPNQIETGLDEYGNGNAFARRWKWRVRTDRSGTEWILYSRRRTQSCGR